MAHSNQVREFLLTDHGVELLDASGALLTGSARTVQEAQEAAKAVLREQETEDRKRELERKRQTVETQIATLRAEFEAEQSAILETIEQDRARARVLADERSQIARLRRADPAAITKT